MRIVVLTVTDHAFANSLLTGLLKDRKEDVVAVINSGVIIPKRSFFSSVFYIVRVSGTKYFLGKLAEALSFKLLIHFSRLFGWRRSSFYDFWMKKYGVKKFTTKNVNSAESVELIKSLKPDVVVSFNFNQILQKKTIKVAKWCVNLHPAPLPKYGGVAPHFWVLLDGCKETAVTTHLVSEKVDLGPILVQRKVNIGVSDSVFGLLMRCSVVGREVLKVTLGGLESGKLTGRVQLEKDSSYCSWPGSSDVDDLFTNGRRLFGFGELFKVVWR